MLYILKITDSHMPQLITAIFFAVIILGLGLHWSTKEDKRREKEERRKVIIDAKLDQDMVSLDEFESKLS